MINKLSKEIHETNKKNGFYEHEKNIGKMLMLIVTKVTEAFEADRKDKWSTDMSLSWAQSTNDAPHFKDHYEETIKGKFQDELADIMIRVMDLAAFKGIDLEGHILLKMEYNKMREYKHGKKY